MALCHARRLYRAAALRLLHGSEEQEVARGDQRRLALGRPPFDDVFQWSTHGLSYALGRAQVWSATGLCEEPRGGGDRIVHRLDLQDRNVVGSSPPFFRPERIQGLRARMTSRGERNMDDIVGIDVSKAGLRVFCLKSREHLCIPNDRPGLLRLRDWLGSDIPELIVFEVTGA